MQKNWQRPKSQKEEESRFGYLFEEEYIYIYCYGAYMYCCCIFPDKQSLASSSMVASALTLASNLEEKEALTAHQQLVPNQHLFEISVHLYFIFVLQ